MTKNLFINERGFFLKNSLKENNFYGRRRFKKLKKSHIKYIDELLPLLNIENSQIFDSIFYSNREVWLEIGFGSGEHLISIAKKNPNIFFVGFEPFIDGVSKILSKIFFNDLKNIFIYPDDFREIIKKIPSSRIGNVFLLFPDPWPKKKHQKRRLINEKIIEELSRIMIKDSCFYTATDVEEYFNFIKEKFLCNINFIENKSINFSNAKKWEGWVETRYEQKGIKQGRIAKYASFQKI